MKKLFLLFSISLGASLMYGCNNMQENEKQNINTISYFTRDSKIYDIIFVGYPIWWYTLPMPLYSFFDMYDFSGKIIVPFNTHEGSGEGGTYSTIKSLEKDAIVLDGLAIRGNDIEKDQTTKIKEWLKELELNETN